MALSSAASSPAARAWAADAQRREQGDGFVDDVDLLGGTEVAEAVVEHDLVEHAARFCLVPRLSGGGRKIGRFVHFARFYAKFRKLPDGGFVTAPPPLF
ncbi:MAG: hypothetical protein MO847_00505 [Candidatus Protistobacter heckmanni]|nr:hypothetical protein [Candidatus Protistobacter heckmanni]